MRQIYAFILSLACITGIYSQQSSNPLIYQGTEVIIDRYPENDFFYTHIFEKGHTIYSLATIFGIKVTDIYSVNNLSAQTPISLGQTVRVPFHPSSLVTYKPTKSNLFLPVYYIAKPKETLYGIAKTYFQQDVKAFAKRNNIQSTHIDIGQKLLIGYLPLDTQDISTLAEGDDKAITPESIIENKEKAVPNPEQIKDDIANAPSELIDSSAIVTHVNVEEKATPQIVQKKARGIALWLRDSKVNNMALVLHNTAKRGSMIEIYNPQLNLRTTAKVLGKIPANTYPDDVTVIVSKKVAESIGALDTRFMVDLTFTEDITSLQLH